MSLILDALNRSRQEREAVPGIAVQHGTDVPQRAWPQAMPWAALFLAAIVIAWLMLERRDSSAPVEAVQGRQAIASQGSGLSAANEMPMAAVVQNAPAPAAAIPVQPADSAQISRSAATQTPPVTSAAKATDASIDKPGSAVAKKQTSAAREPATANDAVRALYADTPARTDKNAAPSARQSAAGTEPAQGESAEPRAAPAVTEEAIDLDSMVRQAREAVKDQQLVEHAVPFLSALSQQEKDAIPTVLYQRHDYTQRSPSVVLNGKTLQVGGSPIAGMKVREILSDSVILEHRGVKFRLRALNSWVNL